MWYTHSYTHCVSIWTHTLTPTLTHSLNVFLSGHIHSLRYSLCLFGHIYSHMHPPCWTNTLTHAVCLSSHTYVMYKARKGITYFLMSIILYIMISTPLYSVLYTASLTLVAPPAALPLDATRLNLLSHRRFVLPGHIHWHMFLMCIVWIHTLTHVLTACLFGHIHSHRYCVSVCVYDAYWQTMRGQFLWSLIYQPLALTLLDTSI